MNLPPDILPCLKSLLFAGLLAMTATALGQPLPAVTLKPVFPKLSDNGALEDKRPVWMSEAPDGTGRMFIVYQTGLIIILQKGSDGSAPREFFNIENRDPKMDNECGLLSLAFSPGFKTNQLFYVYYNQRNPEDQNSRPQNYPIRSVISEFKVSATNPDRADLDSERIILQVPQPFGNHKGGELAFGPDGYLYLGLGDGGSGDDPFGSGQSTSTLLAKMLRIDVNTPPNFGGFGSRRPYAIPQDNPFVNEPDMGDRGARKEIYAYGLRNPWRYSFDRATGALWIGDVGQDLWEAVYLGVKGGNYGWSVMESGHHFKPGPPGAQYLKPVIDYPHKSYLLPEAIYPDHGVGLCVIGGYVYRGRQFPALAGIYLYGDYNLGKFWGLRYDYSAQKVTAHGLLLQQPDNIDSFAEDADGELYSLMQSGRIYQLTAP